MIRLLNSLEHLTIIKIIASFKENVYCSFASHSLCIQFTAAIRIATLYIVHAWNAFRQIRIFNLFLN